MKTEKVDRVKAVQVANVFLQHEAVTDVQVFGSVARTANGMEGKDLDLILVTDSGCEDRFMSITKRELEAFEASQVIRKRRGLGPRDEGYHLKEIRLQAARTALGGNFAELECDAHDVLGWDDDRLDIFVFATDWRSRLAKLQESLPHFDLEFVKNIARDAVSVF